MWSRPKARRRSPLSRPRQPYHGRQRHPAASCWRRWSRCPKPSFAGSTRGPPRSPTACAMRPPCCRLHKQQAAVLADLPLPAEAGADVRCLVLVERSPTKRAAARRPLAHEVVRSTYRVGSERQANPDYVALRRRLREVESDEGLGIMATGDPGLDLIGLIGGVVLNGIGTINRAQSAAAMRERLAATPATLTSQIVGALHVRGHDRRGDPHRPAAGGPGRSQVGPRLADRTRGGGAESFPRGQWQAGSRPGAARRRRCGSGGPCRRRRVGAGRPSPEPGRTGQAPGRGRHARGSRRDCGAGPGGTAAERRARTSGRTGSVEQVVAADGVRRYRLRAGRSPPPRSRPSPERATRPGPPSRARGRCRRPASPRPPAAAPRTPAHRD